MSNTYNNTQISEFQIYRDGQIAKDYKPKVIKKRIKVAMALTAYVTEALALKAVHYASDKFEEMSRPVRLDILDHKYGTNLRSQYFSGVRTQKILQAKRQYGLTS